MSSNKYTLKNLYSQFFPFWDKGPSSIYDLDIFSNDFKKKFGKYYSNFNMNMDGIVYCPESKCYVVYSFDKVKDVLSDTTNISFDKLSGLTFLSDLVLIGSDDDKHLKNKKIITQGIPVLRRHNESKADDFSDDCFIMLLNNIKKKDNVDLAVELVNPLVLTIILKEFGLTELPSEINIHAGKIEVAIENIGKIFEDWRILDEIIQKNLDEKLLTSNLTKLLNQTMDVDSNLNSVDLIRFLIFSGAETTSSLILFSLKSIYKDRRLIKKIVQNGENMNSFLDEVARFYSPVQFAYRSIKNDLKLGKKTVPAGSILALSIGCANLDPLQFDQPNQFLWNRQKKHIAFGFGRYKCIGEHLAKHLTSRFILNFIPVFETFNTTQSNIADSSLMLGNCIHRIKVFPVAVKLFNPEAKND